MKSPESRALTLTRASGTITMRASPQAIAVATRLLEDLEKPVGELVFEIEVLEVDRNYARELGITPPQSTQVYTLAASRSKKRCNRSKG